MRGKWLELLQEIAPRVARVGVLRRLGIIRGIETSYGAIAMLQAPSLGHGIPVRDVGFGTRARSSAVVATFAREPNGGLIVQSDALLDDTSPRSDHRAGGTARLAGSLSGIRVFRPSGRLAVLRA